MKSVLNFLKTVFVKIKIIMILCVLMFAPYTIVSVSDRIKYVLIALYIHTPLIFIYNYVSNWFGANSVFTESASIIILANMIIGGASHFKRDTFSWKELFKKNFFIILVVFISYLVLEKLFSFFADTFAGSMLKSSISFIVLMYPASKFITSMFILTNGKFPPEYLIKLFYTYEKNGRLKDFLEFLSGDGVRQENEEHKENSEQDYNNEQ